MTEIHTSERYLNMLIQHSYSNEEKLGHTSDSVASKLEMIKPMILELNENQRTVQDVLNSEIVERLKKRLKQLVNIPKNDEDFIFTHYKLEIEDLNKILENKK